MEHLIWDVSPILFEFGFIAMRWYGFFFVGSFLLGYLILSKIYKRENKNPDNIENLILFIMAGAVLGARLVHCMFYEPQYYLNNPIEILYVWKGGLASHGGLLGVLLAVYLYAKRYHESFLWLISRLAIPGALTAASIRIGNLFNSEILGKSSEEYWAIIFSRVDMIPRHPVQIYEFLAYIIIFVILILVYKKVSFKLSTKVLPGLFLILVFSSRFILENYKVQQTIYDMNIPFSMGQLLSLPYIVLGIVWIGIEIKRGN